jgi:hypothetical protein
MINIREWSARVLLVISVGIPFSVAHIAFAQAQRVPEGWRQPTASEATESWRRKSATKYLVVRGDFDGDGKPDTALLLVNGAGSKFALFILLASDRHWQQVGEENDVKLLDSMGISLVKPGRYETACGKGYDDSFCAHGEPDYLKLSKPAVDMFVQESADSIVYWDSKAKQFRDIQMSD